MSLTASSVRGTELHDIVGELLGPAGDARAPAVGQAVSVTTAAELLGVVERIREAAASSRSGGGAAHTVVTINLLAERGVASGGGGDAVHAAFSVVVLAAEDDAGGGAAEAPLRSGGAAAVSAALEELQEYNRVPAPVCTLTTQLAVRAPRAARVFGTPGVR